MGWIAADLLARSLWDSVVVLRYQPANPWRIFQPKSGRHARDGNGIDSNDPYGYGKLLKAGRAR